MECPLPSHIDEDDDETDEEIDPQSLTLCSQCFSSPLFRHNHTRFCSVDPYGNHTVVRRTVGVADEHDILLEDIRTLIWDERLHGNLSCLACFDSFSMEKPPAVPLGRQKNHTMASDDAQEGCKETGTYYHRDCYFQTLKYDPGVGGRYCGDEIPLLCPRCLFEKKVGEFKNEFILAFSILKEQFLIESNAVDSVNFERIWNQIGEEVQLPCTPQVLNVTDLQMAQKILEASLCELHKQPWLQHIIHSVLLQ